MKKSVLIIVFCSGAAFMCHAQQNNPNQQDPSSSEMVKTQQQRGSRPSPSEKALMESNRAEKEISLNAEQKKKWEAAAIERASANQNIRQKLQGSTTPAERQQLHADLQKNNQKFDETVSAFLTSDQKMKYDSLKAERREKKMEKGYRKSGKQPLQQK